MQEMNRLSHALMVAGLLAMQAGTLHAAVTAEEAKQLGSTLTLVGAEKAGNKEGTIPAYTGGLAKAPADYDAARGVRPDPFASEKPVASIDAKNMGAHADKLTEGTKALMKAHAGFRVDVFPTHRTAAYPKFVLDNTVKNATQARLSADGLSIEGAGAGVPFPMPKNGNEAMFNYLANFQGMSFVMPKYTGWNVDSAGKAVMTVQGVWTQDSPFFDAARSADNLLVRNRAVYTGPARRNGEALIAIEPKDYTKGDSRAWQYLPGQRRVRLAPDIGHDTPNSSTAGMSTYDDVLLFNGKLDRFDFKLVGKKEVYVPYNTYRFTYNDKPEDALQPRFINPDMVRWELHRVWVVDATLKPGERHIYSRRTFYLDEDSWTIVASDQYDGRGQLWRPGFSYVTQSYDVPAPSNVASGHYDLVAGTYYVNSWPGSGGMKVFDALQPEGSWSPDNLAGKGVR
ncbi:DUF1329 domain-containing protein [Variovorax robiniae]|uniref:DUF1329 domain-containing protein n=1 Tax=Variovorax robiniae TaxID=1836199 RepID=A0ABU8XG09_9BURK